MEHDSIPAAEAGSAETEVAATTTTTIMDGKNEKDGVAMDVVENKQALGSSQHTPKQQPPQLPTTTKDNDSDNDDDDDDNDPMDVDSREDDENYNKEDGKSSSEKSGSSADDDDDNYDDDDNDDDVNNDDGDDDDVNNDDGDDDDGKNNNNNDQDDEEYKTVSGVHREDVFFGRPGTYPRNHQANKRYWQDVLEHAVLYPNVIDDKEEQFRLARIVINKVQKDRGGRFLENEGEGGGWVVADPEIVLHKVRRAIKEKWERSRGKKTKTKPSRAAATTAGLKKSSSSSGKAERSAAAATAAAAAKNKSLELFNPRGDEVKLQDTDVILYFGHSHHVGNKLYWEFVLKEAVPKFGDIVKDKEAQDKLANMCIEFVEKTNGGRFVQPAPKDTWNLVAKDTVLFKVRRAIKERWERQQKGDPSSTIERESESMDIEVEPMDVFLGRPVSSHRSHEGTELYWEHVDKQVPQFGRLLGNRDAQFELAGTVIEHIENEQGGRFLEMDEHGKWGVASYATALEKVHRAIREKWEKRLTSGDTSVDISSGDPKQLQVDPDEQSDIRPMDVLMGKANGGRKGNQMYWEGVLEQVPEFATVVDDKEAQYEMAQKVVDVIEKQNGGRFMEFDEEDGIWKVGDETTVLQKVRRAIKEKWERESKKGKYPALSTSTKKKSKGGGSVDSRARQPSVDISVKKTKAASKAIPKKKAASSSEQMIPLTQRIVDILKGEKRAVSLKQLWKRVDAEREDVDAVCRTLSELGMVHMLQEEEMKQEKIIFVSKIVWWEYAGSFLKRKSWEMMPLGEDTEHVMRSEMSFLVREEAKLDVWISRLRNLMSNPLNPEHMYVTPSDVRCLAGSDPFQPSSSPSGKRTKRTKKEPTLAIHAPFGTVLQSSTPVSYQRDSIPRTRQLVVSCENPGSYDNEIESKDPLQVYFFPNSDQWRNYSLNENPIFGWIREPRYTSETNGMRGAGDSLHVSCLKEDEGVSSFF